MRNYYSNSNVQDVADAITEADDRLKVLRETPLEDVIDQIDGVASAIEEIENQLRYVDSDIEEYEAAREFAEEASSLGVEDVYDLREVIEERDDLLEKVKDSEEVEALRKQVADLEAQVNRGIELENQRIEALAVLGGIDRTQADIDLRAGTELAYETGLSDGILAQAASAKPDHVIGEQGVVDPALLDDEA